MKSQSIIQISAIEHFVYCPRHWALIHCDGVTPDQLEAMLRPMVSPGLRPRP